MTVYNNITLEVHGLATLALNPRAGCITCLTEIPNVTAARMDPTKAISSDQTVTFRVTATPAVRAALLTVGDRVCRIARPVNRGDTTIYADIPTTTLGGKHIWLGAELVRVNSVIWLGNQISQLSVDRAQGGTVAISSTMPVDQAMLPSGTPRGRGLYLGGPATLSGLRVTYRLHDASGDEVLFRGVIGAAYDSGDMIEFTAKSDIERVGAYQHPVETLLYPFASAQYTPQGSSALILRWQLTTAMTQWGFGNDSPDARDVVYESITPIGQGEVWTKSPYIASHGAALSGGVHRSIEDRPPDMLGQAPQPYIATPIYPRPWELRAVAIFGPDGASVGRSSANDESKALSADWYMLAEVEDRPPTGYSTLGARLVRMRGALPNDFLGPQGVAMNRAWARPWVLRHKKNGVTQDGGDGAPEFPTSIAPGSVVALPWASGAGARDQFNLQRSIGLVPADQFAEFNVLTALNPVIGTLRRWNDNIQPIAAIGEHTTMEPLRGGGFVWPFEQWAERAVKDTYFGDIRAMFATVYGPGPEGMLRPIYLAADPFSGVSHKIDETNIRDRDHTIDLTPDLTIERVTLQDLPPTIIAPRALWEKPDEPLSVSSPSSITIVSAHASDEGYSGASVSIKRTPILNRPSAYALDLGLAGAQSVAGGAVAIARSCWSKAVENYGKPHPRTTLVVDRKRFRGFPGDKVDITLGNMPSPAGGLGVTDLRGVVLERGDNIERGTCEVEVLLVGWAEYGQED